MKKILVTGGSGLVGSSIDATIKISSKDLDLRDSRLTNKFFKKNAPDGVIHCAAKVGGLGANINHMADFFYDNILINTNLLNACHVSKVKKVISFLSTCIFPDQVNYPLTEKQIHNGEPHSSNFAYAYAKRMLDVQSRAYNMQYGTNYICVIPTNIYGPNDNFNLKNGHVVPSLIHKCYLAKKNKKNLTIWGTGKPIRDFIFSKDVAKLSKWALNNYNEKEPLIFSTMDNISIEYLVDIIVKHMDFKGKVIWDNTKPDGQIKKPASNKKLLTYLPNFNFTKIDEGILETIEWFNENYMEIRK